MRFLLSNYNSLLDIVYRRWPCTSRFHRSCELRRYRKWSPNIKCNDISTSPPNKFYVKYMDTSKENLSVDIRAEGLNAGQNLQVQKSPQTMFGYKNCMEPHFLLLSSLTLCNQTIANVLQSSTFSTCFAHFFTVNFLRVEDY